MADEEVVVKLSLIDEMSNEIKGIRANMETNFSAANKKLAESKGAFSSLGNEIKGNFVSAIKGAVIGIAGLQVVTKTIANFKMARSEYQENTLAQNRLRFAIGGTSFALQEQAKIIGDKLKIDDTEVTLAQAKIATYIKSEQQIKAILPALLDLGAYIGSNESAAQMLGRAFADDGAELGRLKVKVDGAAGSQERLNSIIAGVTKNFGGQAQAAAEVRDVWDLLALKWKDANETFYALMVNLSKGNNFAASDTQLLAESQYKLDKQLVKTGKTFEGQAASQELISKKKIAIQKYEDQQMFNPMRINALGAAMDRQQEENKKRDDERLKQIEENNKKQKELQDQAIASGNAMLPNRETFEGQQVWQKEQADKAIMEEVERNRISETNRITTIQKVAEYEKWAADQKLKYDLMAAERQKQNVVNGLQMSGQLFSAIANSNKRSAQEKKNIARVEAGINTAVAITKALPNPMAVAFAAAIGIAQQVAISNAKFATGAAYQGGGMALVGENGPEYVNLPRGASVYNNTQTRNMTTNASMNVTIMDSSGNITETLRAQLRSGQGDQLVRDIQNRLARQI